MFCFCFVPFFFFQELCKLSYNGTTGTAGTYAVALTLEDFPAGTTDFSSVAAFSRVGLHFLVIISKKIGSCDDVPTFTESTPKDGECTEVQIGSGYRETIEATISSPSKQYVLFSEVFVSVSLLDVVLF